MRRQSCTAIADELGISAKTVYRVINNSADFCNYILDEAKVAIVPGSAFEAPDNVRISYSNSMENIQKGIDRIEAAMAKLK